MASNAKSSVEHKRHIERYALAAGIVQPLITLPQIVDIYSNQSARDVSLITWMGYLAFGLVFLVYGIVFNLRPIWIGQVVWVTMQTIIVIGILKYG